MVEVDQGWCPTKILAAGHPGAEQGALDAAIELGVEHGGWCAHGRRLADGGGVPERFHLQEAALLRTAHSVGLNTMDADATLQCLVGPAGGRVSGLEQDWETDAVRRLAKEMKKPFMAVDLEDGMETCAGRIREWLESCACFGRSIQTLHVTGLRESQASGIGEVVQELMRRVLSDEGESIDSGSPVAAGGQGSPGGSTEGVGEDGGKRHLGVCGTGGESPDVHAVAGDDPQAGETGVAST